jgi:hypothetical protein
MRDPFSTEDILPESLTTNEKGKLIELSCDGSLQQMFKKMDLTEFWLNKFITLCQSVCVCWINILHTLV